MIHEFKRANGSRSDRGVWWRNPETGLVCFNCPHCRKTMHFVKPFKISRSGTVSPHFVCADCGARIMAKLLDYIEGAA